MPRLVDRVARRLLHYRQSMRDPESNNHRPATTGWRGRRGLPRSRAFTLVELAVVVTIVGVLAVIAVVAYRKFTLSAKVTEAQNMISAIRIAEEDYKTERGTYLDLSAGWCPTDGVTVPNKKTDWSTPGCGVSAGSPWGALPVHVDGPVQFGYKVTAAPSPVPNITWINMTAAVTGAVTSPWYVIQAQADLNGDGATGVNSELANTSFANTIFSHNDGE